MFEHNSALYLVSLLIGAIRRHSLHGRTDKFRESLTLAAQSLADASPVPVFVTMPSAAHVYLNAAMQRLRGSDEASSIFNVSEVFTPTTIQELETIGDAPVGSTSALLSVLRLDAPNYEREFSVVLLRDEAGKHLIFGTAAVDLAAPGFDSPTSQEISRLLDKRLPEEVSSPSLKTHIFRFAERSNFGLLVLDDDGLCRYVNSTVERILDSSRNAMLGKPLDAFVPANSSSAFRRRILERLETRDGGTQTIEIDVEGLGRREISFRWYPISESPSATGIVITDVTTAMIRKRTSSAMALLSASSDAMEILGGMRRALRAEAVALLQLWPGQEQSIVVEHLFDGTKDREGESHQAALANQMTRAAQSYLDEVGSLRRVHKLTTEDLDDFTLLLRPIEGASGAAEAFLAVTLKACPDGWSAYEESMETFSRRMSVRFESDRRSLEIVERRKRESLEELARGIAHDFNNVLMSIYGHLQLMERKVSKLEDQGLQRNVAHALRSSERGKSLVNAMIAFSQNSLPTLVSAELSEIMKAAVDGTAGKLGDAINVRYSVESKRNVLADPETLQNAIEALIYNARDAIDAARSARKLVGEGQILLQIQDSTAIEGQARVRLIISDNGSGMSEEVKRRIFDPFYTTRDPGSGTGLGMAVVQATLSRLQGEIDVRSKLDQGTQVILTLPTYIGKPESRPIRETDSYKRSETQRLRARKAKHVLVVDDLAEQRELIVECLREEGYSTEEASDGQSAFDMVRLNTGVFDLVILDRHMPGISGDALARMIFEIEPNLPMVVLSGYIDSQSRDQLRQFGVTECLQKPVGIDDLIQTIDSVVKNRQRKRLQ